MNLDLGRLRTLEAVHRMGSMTAAAAALGYTTGAVSQQMATLERSLKVKLFEQVGRGVRLTDEGAILVEYAARILQLEGEAHEALRGATSSVTAHVRIGVFGTAAAELLPPALAVLRSEHPGLTLRTVEVEVDQATAAVESGEVHVAFGVDYSDAPIPRRPTVRLRKLRSERFDVAVSAGRPLPTGTVSLSELADEPWILPPASSQYGAAMRYACRRAGFEPVVEHEVTDTASSLAMVAADLGVAPVTALMLALRGQGTRTIGIREDVHRELVLAHRHRPEPQPGVQAVLDVVTAAVDTPRAPQPGADVPWTA